MMTEICSISESLNTVSRAIQRAAERTGRDPREVTLVAASKTATINQVEEAMKWGLRTFGENRVQEALTKFVDSGLRQEIHALHLIGPLQSNKVKKVVGIFNLIHSVDSLYLAQKIENEAARQSITQAILVEVNIGAEASKHGVSVKETPRLVEAILNLPHLSLLGLMTLPPACDDPEEARPYFAKLRQLGQGLGLHQFSMGMSSDFEIAIEEGATWVRVGTAIFGRRTP